MYNPYELTDAAQKKYAGRDPFGRIPEKTKDEDAEIKDLGDPSALSKPVGVTGKNDRKDVAKAETMLGAAGALDLKKTEGPTGYWGMRTEDATKTFQKKHGLKVDGQINPGGETIRTLAKVAGQALKAFANSNRHPEQAALRRDSGSRGGGEKILNQVQDDVALKLSDDALAENRRTAHALGKYKGVGDLPRFTTDAISTHGEKAVHEVADLIGQVYDRSPDHAEELLQKTMQGLAPTHQESLVDTVREITAPNTQDDRIVSGTPPYAHLADDGTEPSEPEEPRDPSAPSDPEEPSEPKEPKEPDETEKEVCERFRLQLEVDTNNLNAARTLFEEANARYDEIAAKLRQAYETHDDAVKHVIPDAIPLVRPVRKILKLGRVEPHDLMGIAADGVDIAQSSIQIAELEKRYRDALAERDARQFDVEEARAQERKTLDELKANGCS